MTQTSSGKTQGSLNIINVKNTLKACSIRVKQGARRADMNTQGECPGLGASAPSGREGNSRGVKGIAGMCEGNGLTLKKALFAYIYQI